EDWISFSSFLKFGGRPGLSSTLISSSLIPARSASSRERITSWIFFTSHPGGSAGGRSSGLRPGAHRYRRPLLWRLPGATDWPPVPRISMFTPIFLTLLGMSSPFGTLYHNCIPPPPVSTCQVAGRSPYSAIHFLRVSCPSCPSTSRANNPFTFPIGTPTLAKGVSVHNLRMASGSFVPLSGQSSGIGCFPALFPHLGFPHEHPPSTGQ